MNIIFYKEILFYFIFFFYKKKKKKKKKGIKSLIKEVECYDKNINYNAILSLKVIF